MCQMHSYAEYVAKRGIPLLRTLAMLCLTLAASTNIGAAGGRSSDAQATDGHLNTATVDDAGLPSDEEISEKLRALGDSLGWALLHHDSKEGLLIWRFKLISPIPDRHLPRDGLFTWYWKREGNAIVKDDRVLIAPFTVGANWEQEAAHMAFGVRLLQHEFKRRFREMVGPVELQGRADSFMSSDHHAQIVMNLLVDENHPPVKGDDVMVVTDEARILAEDALVDTVPFGTVLTVRGFDGDRLSVRYRRPGSICRGDVQSLDRAIKELDRRLAEAPDDVPALSARGNARTFQREFDKAISDHDRVIELTPHNPVALHRRGLAWHTKGEHSQDNRDIDEAIVNYNKALRIAPDDSTVYNDRGLAHLLQGNYSMALADFDAALHLDLNYALAFMNRGIAWTREGHAERGLADFCEALRLDPQDDATLINRAFLWLQIGEPAKAQKDVEEAIRLDPKWLALLQPTELGKVDFTPHLESTPP